MNYVIERNEGTTRVLQLNHPNHTNPFNVELEDHIKAALRAAHRDERVKAIVVTGGAGRSFSAGGDFNEVKNLSGGDDVDRWIDRVTDLYASALEADKPTVAAIDGYAIGMGFQFAMMFDWRVMAQGAEFRMPELKHGLGCSVGSAILSSLVGLQAAREIVFGCHDIPAEQALSYRLVNEVAPAHQLMERALAAAQALAGYPEVAYRTTKRFLVSDLMKTLYETAEASKQVHRASFRARAMHTHFERVLGEDKYAQPGPQDRAPGVAP